MRDLVHLRHTGHAAARPHGDRRGRGEEALPRVLVTDADQRSSLAVVRSLGRAGHDVLVCDSHPRPLAGASRFARRTFTVPDHATRPGEYRDAVARLAAEEDVELLIPTTDGSASLLSDGFPGVTVPSSGLDRYRALSDKVALMEAAPALGIAVPRQTVLEAPGEAEPPRELGFPLVVKPARSAVKDGDDLRHLRVRFVNDPSELGPALEDLPAEAYPVMLQERIVGPGRGVFLLVWEGRLHAAFGHRRLREKPVRGGVSVYRESVEVSPELREKGRRLLEHFGWNGVAMVEFKEDAATGIPYLMEVNARFWGSLQLAVDSGVDFPRLLVELATGKTPEPVTTYRTGIRSRWLWGEVDHLLGVLRSSGVDRAAMPDLPRPLAALGHFMVPWKPGDRWEVLRPSDPRPFLRETARWFGDLRSRR